jgi:hypothetical protein
LGSLSEPHRKQNLYANPKRTAKLSIICLIRRAGGKKVQTYFKKLFTALTKKFLAK